MCERDSSQAKLMIKNHEPSVTLKGIEKMAEAIYSEHLGETGEQSAYVIQRAVRNACLKTYLAGGGGAPICTWPSTTGRTPQQLRLGRSPGDR